MQEEQVYTNLDKQDKHDNITLSYLEDKFKNNQFDTNKLLESKDNGIL